MTTRPRIFIVDDDEAVVRLMARRLEPFYDVLATTDPLQVRGLLRASPPDAVLCDIEMPGLGGGELAAALARDPATCAIPVVFMTELATPDEVDALGGSIGGHPAVAKGAATSEVVAAIEKACGVPAARGNGGRPADPVAGPPA